jgi:hypothetical protein
VAAGQHISLDAQAFSCQSLLKIQREEPVASSCHDSDGDLGPLDEVAGRSEHGVRLRRFLAGGENLSRNVVQEVGLGIELGPVAAGLGRRDPGLGLSGVLPPRPWRLASYRDHGVHQDDAGDWASSGGHWRGETAEGLSDQHHVVSAGRCGGDQVRVFGQASCRVRAWQVDRDRVAAGLAQQWNNELPVPGGGPARAGNQDERAWQRVCLKVGHRIDSR